MRNGREVKIGKKFEYVTVDRKRILVVHNVTEEDVGIYECALSEDRVSLQLALKGVAHQNLQSDFTVKGTLLIFLF